MKNIIVDTSRKSFWTDDYERFEYHKYNREIYVNHVDSMIKKISKANLLGDNPLLILKDEYEREGRWILVDGQHRLAAAMELGIPVRVAIAEQTTMAHVASLNSASKRWNNNDYLKLGVSLGLPDYIAIELFMRVHPKITLGIVMRHGMIGDFKTVKQAFEDCNYIANDLFRLDHLAGCLMDIHSFGFRHAYERKFMTAMATVINSGLYKHAKMIRQMERISRRMVGCATVGEYVDMITEIYNYCVRRDKRVDFKMTNLSRKERFKITNDSRDGKSQAHKWAKMHGLELTNEFLRNYKAVESSPMFKRQNGRALLAA